jgi:hypothetical protein
MMTGSDWVSLLEIKDISGSDDEEDTSLVEGVRELELDDVIAWASVKGTTTMMVAIIKDKEKYPNRLRR